MFYYDAALQFDDVIAYRKGVIESGKDRNGHLSWPHLFYPKGWSGGNMGVRPLGPKEIDGLLS